MSPPAPDRLVLPLLGPPFNAAILVCEKCCKRATGSKKAGKRFVNRLREAARAAGPRARQRPRVVRCGCLDVCPKRHIVVVVAEARQPARLLLARPDAQLHDLLGPSHAPVTDTPIENSH